MYDSPVWPSASHCNAGYQPHAQTLGMLVSVKIGIMRSKQPAERDTFPGNTWLNANGKPAENWKSPRPLIASLTSPPD